MIENGCRCCVRFVGSTRLRRPNKDFGTRALYSATWGVSRLILAKYFDSLNKTVLARITATVSNLYSRLNSS